MKKYDFVREQIKQAKKELKDRKLWKKALEHELTLERTYKYGMRDKVFSQLQISRTMVKHYENVVNELEAMLKEMIKIEGE